MKILMRFSRLKLKAVVAFWLFIFACVCFAETPVVHVVLKDHLFIPAKVKIPAQVKVKLVIENQDDTLEEFDSFYLNREKVLFPHRKNVIYIGPLKPGQYAFFGEYHPNLAQGVVEVVAIKGESHVD